MWNCSSSKNHGNPPSFVYILCSLGTVSYIFSSFLWSNTAGSRRGDGFYFYICLDFFSTDLAVWKKSSSNSPNLIFEKFFCEDKVDLVITYWMIYPLPGNSRKWRFGSRCPILKNVSCHPGGHFFCIPAEKNPLKFSKWLPNHYMKKSAATHQRSIEKNGWE